MSHFSFTYSLEEVSNGYNVSQELILQLHKEGKICLLEKDGEFVFDKSELIRLQELLPGYEPIKPLTLEERKSIYDEKVKDYLNRLTSNFEKLFDKSRNKTRLLEQEVRLFENLFFEEKASIKNQIISNINYPSDFEYASWRFSTVEVMAIRQTYNKIIEQGDRDYSRTRHPKDPITIGGGDSHYIRVEAFWAYLYYLKNGKQVQSFEELLVVENKFNSMPSKEVILFFKDELSKKNPSNQKPFLKDEEIKTLIGNILSGNIDLKEKIKTNITDRQKIYIRTVVYDFYKKSLPKYDKTGDASYYVKILTNNFFEFPVENFQSYLTNFSKTHQKKIT